MSYKYSYITGTPEYKPMEMIATFPMTEERFLELYRLAASYGLDLDHKTFIKEGYLRWFWNKDRRVWLSETGCVCSNRRE